MKNKNRLLSFKQWISLTESNESDIQSANADSSEASIQLMDLMDSYVKVNHPTGSVLVAVDISNNARDLIFGGIEIILNPNKEKIEELSDYYYYESYKNGKRISDNRYGEDE